MLGKTTKNRFGYKLDKLFWWIVTLFPIFAYLFFLITASLNQVTSEITFAIFLNERLGIFQSMNSTISIPFYRIFGPNGIIPMFSNNSGLIQLFSYFVSVEVLHVLFDIIVFIPRLAHKWISKAVQDD